MYKKILTVAFVSLTFFGCAKIDIIDYSLPKSEQERIALVTMQDSKMRAIYNFERVLLTESLKVEMTDVTGEDQSEQRSNNFKLGIGFEAQGVLQRALDEALSYTLQLTSNQISYAANSIIYCEKKNSFSEIEIAIYAFVCDGDTTTPHVNLDKLQYPFFNATIPHRAGKELSITSSEVHPYENIRWYLLTSEGIIPIQSQDDTILMPNLESRYVIFAVAKSEHDSFVKGFIWIVTPEQELQS